MLYSVEIGRNHGRYRTILSTDNHAQAQAVYHGYNVHSGGKKRLLWQGMVIARVITSRGGADKVYGS
jgi:hypothetical protein